MSRALTLIALAISNLLVLFYSLTLFNVRFVQSQELYSEEQPSRILVGLTNGGKSSVEIDNNGQQFEDNSGNNGAPLDSQQQLQQSSQSLQLILTKLFPTLKHWNSKNSQPPFDSEESTPSVIDQTAANELQEQSSATLLPNLSQYVIADNYNHNHNNNPNPNRSHHQYHRIPSNINLNETGTTADNANSPIRQLISAHSNALFYPPTEQPYQEQQPQQQPQQHQLSQLSTNPYNSNFNNNNNLPDAHYSDLTLQTQQSFLPTHLQSLDSNKPSLPHYTLPTSYHHYSMAPQTQILPSKPTTNLIVPYTNLLHPQSLPISSSSSSSASSHLQQLPYYASFKPFSLEQIQPQPQPQQQQTPKLSQQKPTQSASHLSSMLAFLANNRANLSNFIQLLPLIAQTISVLPKVFPTSASGLPQATPISEIASPSNYLLDSNPQPSKSNPSSSSILSLIQSTTSPGKNLNATDKLTERFQHSSNTDLNNQQPLTASGDNQPSISSIGLSNQNQSRLQSLFSNSIFTQVLPQIARQLVFASLNQLRQSSGNPSSQYEFPEMYQPDVGYSLDSSPSHMSSLSPNSLTWIKSLIGSLTSAQKQQHSPQQQRPLHRTSWQPHSTQEMSNPSGSDLNSASSISTFSTTTSLLDNIRPVSQILNSWLLNRINGNRSNRQESSMVRSEKV